MKIGMAELLVILGIALLIFGPSKLPALGKAVGQTIRNFRSGADGVEQDGVKKEAAETQGEKV